MNIKQIVNDTLSNDEQLTNLIGQNKIWFIKAPATENPFITFFIYDEYGKLYTDDIEEKTEYKVQVDIWSETDYTEIEERVVEVMENNNFTRASAQDFYEDDSNIYHKVLRYNYIKERGR
ncbi:MAG: hypothetical protein A2Y24_06870 [Clostridiales bacterium GWE2_32_10]|nr:MAG: hypothetical protein A2Y24_06870 [Clostridiales bacterium GWE2_32_10]HBY19975.1 prohead protease [Clostridiales bacterium]